MVHFCFTYLCWRSAVFFCVILGRGALRYSEVWMCARVADLSSYLLQRAEFAGSARLKWSDMHRWLHRLHKKGLHREKGKKRRSDRKRDPVGGNHGRRRPCTFFHFFLSLSPSWACLFLLFLLWFVKAPPYLGAGLRARDHCQRARSEQAREKFSKCLILPLRLRTEGGRERGMSGTWMRKAGGIWMGWMGGKSALITGGGRGVESKRLWDSTMNVMWAVVLKSLMKGKNTLWQECWKRERDDDDGDDDD